ncbi:nucleotidyltransferase domain-containing protein [Paenibacillus sp. CN-4]|uniref:nucleotidyltransferase domain-containing protein n=1 Tax=Paenibacillus nanchangensis TaxID=3348343 RepID=UPI00397A0C82
MTAINEQIMQALHTIETEEGVRILYACESGSRAWGFPSKDSDYDVRFLYIRRPEWYLSIEEGRDVIERPISSLLDVSGWDLKKALRLFRKSNPPLLEWLQSPIIYHEVLSVAGQIRKLSPLTFSPRSCMYHYLHMARGNYRDYLQGERVRLKKYFYVLRPILACEWIETYGEMPPIEFGTLVDWLVPEGTGLKGAIEELLARKMAGDELDDQPRIDALNQFLEQKLKTYEQLAPKLPAGGGTTLEQANTLFRSALQEAWGNQ